MTNGIVCMSQIVIQFSVNYTRNLAQKNIVPLQLRNLVLSINHILKNKYKTFVVSSQATIFGLEKILNIEFTENFFVIAGYWDKKRIFAC